MTWSEKDSEWQYWVEKGGSVQRVSFDTVDEALIWYIWPNKLQRTLYTLISDWDQENVDVSRQDGTITLQVTLDDSYGSIWESASSRWNSP